MYFRMVVTRRVESAQEDVPKYLWDFISEKVFNGDIVRETISFKELCDIEKAMGDVKIDPDKICFTSEKLWHLVGMLNYMIGAVDMMGDEFIKSNLPIIQSMCQDTVIEAYGNYAEYVESVNNPEAHPKMFIRSKIIRERNTTLPDHPYFPHGINTYVESLTVEPFSMNDYVPDEDYVGLFENITCEHLSITFNRQMDPLVVKSMFNMTSSRVVVCSLYNCSDDYMLTTAAFTNINFNVRDDVKYTGAAYIELNYHMQSTDCTDSRKLFIN